MTAQADDDFTARDAFVVLRLLDEESSGTTDVVRDGLHVRIERGSGPVATPEARAPGAERCAIVRAPVVGRVRWSVDLSGPVSVRAGEVLGRVELGARTTSVASERSGTVVRRHVADGDFVEYGQALLVVKPAG